jgi:hypothetical protein
MKKTHLDQITLRMIQLVDIIKLRDGEISGQKDFAKSIGANPSIISQWKTAKQHCTLAQVYSACQVYSVSPSWLVLGIGEVFMSGNQITQLGVNQKVADLEKRIARMEFVLRNSKTTTTQKRAAKA